MDAITSLMYGYTSPARREFLISSPEDAKVGLDPGVVTKVIEAVRGRGYIYIDSTMLNVPYTGVDQRYKGGTWWVRFFDYL